MWEPDGAEGHVGRVGVLLEDGTVPGPVYIDIGSGGGGAAVSDWFSYDGSFGRPRADRMRAVCACGWASGTAYPIDWELVPDLQPHLFDTSAPERDWAAHTRKVTTAAVQVPEDIARVISQVRERLDKLEDHDPLTALRIVTALDAVIEIDGTAIARTAAYKHTDREIAAALGSTEKALTARLRRYGVERY
ncbi:hypothetical protein ACFYOG_34400 [Streptomyces sp. NPDC007818]|uniref:hypothetical protein n=1 Tax=Streptomyces sp. NPDC007818 TaxID=3364780 RepID=UPI0036C0495E